MRTYKELNEWSKDVIGLPIWLTIIVACIIEWGISVMPGVYG